MALMETEQTLFLDRVKAMDATNRAINMVRSGSVARVNAKSDCLIKQKVCSI